MSHAILGIREVPVVLCHTIVQYHRGLGRWSDDAMVRQCSGYGAMTMVRWYTLTVKQFSIKRHRTIVIEPSSYRLFCTCAYT